MKHASRRIACLFALATAAGCTASAEGEPQSQEQVDTREIPGRVSAKLVNSSSNNARFEGSGDWAWHSTVAVFTNVPGMGSVECTGTIIGPHHVITAASCFPSTTSTIGFFWNGAADDAFTPRANVLHVYERSGVSATTDWKDSSGNQYNIAVLQLDRDVPWQVPAWLNSPDPTPGTWGFQVGLGPLNNNPSTFGIMQEHQTTVRGEGAWGSDFFHNHMLTDDPAAADGSAGTRGGDMGGPMYGWGPAYGGHGEGSIGGGGGLPAGQAMSIWGVYAGRNPWNAFGDRAEYTNLSWRNLDFITKAMGLHVSDLVGWQRLGTVLDTIDVTGQSGWACPDMCLKRRSCVAENTVSVGSTVTCTLLSAVSGTSQYNYASSSSKSATGACTLDATGICRL